MYSNSYKIGDRVKDLRLEKRLKRAEVAKRAGISYDYLTKIENNQRNPNIAILGKICEALGASIEELFVTKTESRQVAMSLPPKKLFRLGGGKPVPLIGWTRAGSWEEASDGELPPGWAEDWFYSELGGGKVFALRVEGDSMEPEFQEGDYILVDPARDPFVDDFVIAKIKDENSATFKQLKYKRGKMILHPLNPIYPDIVIGKAKPAHIVGVVVEKKKFFGHDSRGEKLAMIAKRIEKLDETKLDKVIQLLDNLFPG